MKHEVPEEKVDSVAQESSEKQFSVVLTFASTSHKENFRNLIISSSIDKLEWLSAHYKLKFEVLPSFSNEMGLSAVYNLIISYIENSYSNKTNGCIVFVHDDVSIQDLFFFDKLKHYHEKYDVIGVAGSTQINSKSERIAWHLSDKKSHRGFVMHKQSDDLFTMNSFGPAPSEVATIDGVLMSISFNALFKHNLRFDEDFSFDFYDMSLCAKALIKKLKIGIIPLLIYHDSHGNGILDNRYIEASEKFNKKYMEKLRNLFGK
jgi:hypothetical protein